MTLPLDANVVKDQDLKEYGEHMAVDPDLPTAPNDPHNMLEPSAAITQGEAPFAQSAKYSSTMIPEYPPTAREETDATLDGSVFSDETLVDNRRVDESISGTVHLDSHNGSKRPQTPGFDFLGSRGKSRKHGRSPEKKSKRDTLKPHGEGWHQYLYSPLAGTSTVGSEIVNDMVHADIAFLPAIVDEFLPYANYEFEKFTFLDEILPNLFLGR
jgi:hypothetical protein